MAGADSIDAEVLQQPQSPLQHLVRHGGAEATGVVMNANALELDRPAVERKTFAGIEPGRADAEGRCGLVNHRFPGLQPAAEPIERRGFRRPQLRIFDFERLDHDLRRPLPAVFVVVEPATAWPSGPRISDCREKDSGRSELFSIVVSTRTTASPGLIVGW